MITPVIEDKKTYSAFVRRASSCAGEGGTAYIYTHTHTHTQTQTQTHTQTQTQTQTQTYTQNRGHKRRSDGTARAAAGERGTSRQRRQTCRARSSAVVNPPPTSMHLLTSRHSCAWLRQRVSTQLRMPQPQPPRPLGARGARARGHAGTRGGARCGALCSGLPYLQGGRQHLHRRLRQPVCRLSPLGPAPAAPASTRPVSGSAAPAQWRRDGGWA